MNARKISAALGVAATAILLSACASGTGASAGADGVVGTWSQAAESVPNITLADDGTFTGNDGCVTFTGEWSQDGDTVTLDKVVAPAMACADVDQWLSRARSLAVQNSELQVYSAAGELIGTLPKAS